MPRIPRHRVTFSCSSIFHLHGEGNAVDLPGGPTHVDPVGADHVPRWMSRWRGKFTRERSYPTRSGNTGRRVGGCPAPTERVQVDTSMMGLVRTGGRFRWWFFLCRTFSGHSRHPSCSQKDTLRFDPKEAAPSIPKPAIQAFTPGPASLEAFSQSLPVRPMSGKWRVPSKTARVGQSSPSPAQDVR